MLEAHSYRWDLGGTQETRQRGWQGELQQQRKRRKEGEGGSQSVKRDQRREVQAAAWRVERS